ncbi:hypothetical protein KIPB_017001, partial [Kipferlia bialata]
IPAERLLECKSLLSLVRGDLEEGCDTTLTPEAILSAARGVASLKVHRRRDWLRRVDKFDE